MTAPSAAVPRILLVVCGEPEPSIAAIHGGFDAWFRNGFGASAELDVLDARTEPLDSARFEGVSGVVISGSPHSVYERLPWITALEGFVREALLVRELPLLGVCFGHQLVAQACGGRVEKNPRGRAIGTVEIVQYPAGLSHSILGALPERFFVQSTHCDTVTAPPPNAIVLARSSLDDCEAYAYGSALCVQFHPEIVPDVIRGYLWARAERIAAEGLDPEALRAQVRETDLVSRIFEGFTAATRAHAAARRATRTSIEAPVSATAAGPDVTARAS